MAAAKLAPQESGATRHSLPVPGTNRSVSVEVGLVAADQLAPSLQASSNVAKVSIGGMEFFAVVGKTEIPPYG